MVISTGSSGRSRAYPEAALAASARRPGCRRAGGARSRMPTIPRRVPSTRPAARAGPSSLISRLTVPSAQRTLTWASRAWLCRRVLVRDSCTIRYADRSTAAGRSVSSRRSSTRSPVACSESVSVVQLGQPRLGLARRCPRSPTAAAPAARPGWTGPPTRSCRAALRARSGRRSKTSSAACGLHHDHRHRVCQHVVQLPGDPRRVPGAAIRRCSSSRRSCRVRPSSPRVQPRRRPGDREQHVAPVATGQFPRRRRRPAARAPRGIGGAAGSGRSRPGRRRPGRASRCPGRAPPGRRPARIATAMAGSGQRRMKATDPACTSASSRPAASPAGVLRAARCHHHERPDHDEEPGGDRGVDDAFVAAVLHSAIVGSAAGPVIGPETDSRQRIKRFDAS